MKFSGVLISIASISTLATAASWTEQFRLSSAPIVQDDDLKVPGDNPLFHCASPANDLLEIESVDLSPNPPAAGKNLTITASGTLSKDVGEGAYVQLQVKYGLITLIKQTADLCEQAGNIDLECPIKAGETKLTKDVELPSQVPPGKYTVLADVYTKDDEKITCLTAQVIFHAGGRS